jgi:hypothetical protein
MKQTAVEYLLHMYALQGAIYQYDIDKAIEMEKEQMLQSYANGQADSLSLIKNMKDIPSDFNQIISDNFNDLV